MTQILRQTPSLSEGLWLLVELRILVLSKEARQPLLWSRERHQGLCEGELSGERWHREFLGVWLKQLFKGTASSC